MSLAPFVRADGGAHLSIDPQKLQETFPTLKDKAWNISSPSHLASWERLRARHGFDKFDSVPCDLFVWATGEAPDPRLTRG